ncbi:2OG-Fe(II) oxygenase superfamily [Novymonas esmeraldas]|uniref:2OG-Fe(II) oxygenase superfamily n=1 Tax=Novymonas esmeraldas TaxID=1808958 RepID=A0AAW0EX14_9TRYP
MSEQHSGPACGVSPASEALTAAAAAAAAADTPCSTKRTRDGAAGILSTTPFRLAEKRYKLYELSRRDSRRLPALPETDMSDVVQLHDIEGNTEANRRLIHRVVLPPRAAAPDGGAAAAVSAAEVPCYTFAGVPGLLLFPGAVSAAEQQRWCREAVMSYGDAAQHPNILSTHAKAPQRTTCYQPPMRWATLGFSYEWTAKVYHRERYSPFPAELRQRLCDLVSLVAQVQQDGFTCAHPELYEPQTAIVNYYPVGSMMMCHQDVSEETMEQPLLSLSLGCSSIFLMGTQSREEAPHAFLLRSGDVAAFTGPSRSAFHATPRILDDCPAHLTVADEDLTEAERQRYQQHAYYAQSQPNGAFSPVDKAAMTAEERERYWRLCMRHMRININARQVYGERCPFIFTAPHASAEPAGADSTEVNSDR